MEALLQLSKQLGDSFYALRRAATHALQKGKTRSLAFEDSQIILFLHEHGACPMQEISQGTGHDFPSTSRMVSNLEEKGFLSKQADKLDKRKKIVTLTEKGQEAVIEIRETFSLVLEKVLASLSLLERREMHRMLSEIEQVSRNIRE